MEPCSVRWAIAAAALPRCDKLWLMPNGDDKNWCRLCAAIDGFRERYGRWPTRVRMPEGYIRDIAHCFTVRDFLTVTAKIQFVSDDALFLVEDDEGGSYRYCEGDFTRTLRTSASAWFGVSPKPDLY